MTIGTEVHHGVGRILGPVSLPETAQPRLDLIGRDRSRGPLLEGIGKARQADVIILDRLRGERPAICISRISAVLKELRDHNEIGLVDPVCEASLAPEPGLWYSFFPDGGFRLRQGLPAGGGAIGDQGYGATFHLL